MAKFPKYFHFRVLVDANMTKAELCDVSDHDFVEVVRCKDCKYCKVECGNYCCYVDDYLKMPTPHYGDFYCADGEPRDDNGND